MGNHIQLKNESTPDLIPINPELLAERAKGTRDEGVKAWSILSK